MYPLKLDTCRSVSTTLVARFMLDLRSAAYRNNTITPDQVSSVRFAADLAAPLGPDSTWVTGQSDGVESDDLDRTSPGQPSELEQPV